MGIELRQEEEVQFEADFHWSVFIVPGIWAGFIGLGLLGQLFMKEGTMTGVFWTAVVGFGPLVYVWLKNKSKSYVVTNQRLYVEEGVLSKSKTDIPFHKINDISFSQTLSQRLFGSGNISVMTGNDKATKLGNLNKPEGFREALSKICHKKTA